ncbi:MAG: type II toxin-antitoxin system VapC family toxin [Thermoanaerobaculia bacterium]
MIALDTNVLVRYLVRDEPRQTAAATRLLESACTEASPGIVTQVVLCELTWVLDRGYRYSRSQIAEILRGLLGATDLAIESSELAWQALNRYQAGKADFADYVLGLAGRTQKAEITVTFDRQAASSELFRLISA